VLRPVQPATTRFLISDSSSLRSPGTRFSILSF
jgi:hypothetical protein